MSDTANVIVGPAALYLATSGTALPTLTSLPVDWSTFDEAGYTDDGVQFTYTPTFKDINVDEELAPVKKLLTAEKLEISVKLAETTLINLQKSIAGSSLVKNDVNGNSVLYLGSPNQSAIQEYVLGIEGPAPGSSSTRVIAVYRVISMAGVTLHYQRKDKVVYTVKFEALADSTKSAGQRLCKMIDFEPTGS